MAAQGTMGEDPLLGGDQWRPTTLRNGLVTLRFLPYWLLAVLGVTAFFQLRPSGHAGGGLFDASTAVVHNGDFEQFRKSGLPCQWQPHNNPVVEREVKFPHSGVSSVRITAQGKPAYVSQTILVSSGHEFVSFVYSRVFHSLFSIP